jgi:ATP-dependent exoDNAse (exonuclease V) alpha subunit
LPDDFVLTDEFRYAYDLMENSKKCLFITGKAGTGKSTLITYFRMNTKKNVAYLAPTGIAALNIHGKTLHSFFKFPLHLIETADIRPDYKRQEIFKKLDAIVIDEISMARADIVDGIDTSLQVNRKVFKPFGGVQMIFIGDLYQLPPVVNSKETVNLGDPQNNSRKIPLKQFFEMYYRGIYFFNSKAFSSVQFEYIELAHIFRQKDSLFINLLNAFREQTFLTADLEVLNRQYEPYDETDSNEVRLTICTTNAIANGINEQNMNKLSTKPYIYEAVIEGQYDTELYPTERNLILKTGAQVMMLKNDTDGHGWVNGSLGIVKYLSEDNIEVEIGRFTYRIKREVWSAIEYEYDQEAEKIEAKVIGSFIQYPIKAAWAVTIHKSQGQTFDRIAIDLGNGAFAHGQTYVALSRCTSLEGIILRKPVQYTDIILDPKVVGFMKKMRPEDVIF